jgi:type IV pilus assembly protein PilO
MIEARDQELVLKESLAALGRLMPAEPQESTLINTIQGMADDCGIQFQQIQFEKRVPKQGYVEMPVKFTFQGRYNGLLALLDKLQKGSRAVRIDEVKVGKGKEDLPQIKVDVTASAFFVQ